MHAITKVLFAAAFAMTVLVQILAAFGKHPDIARGDLFTRWHTTRIYREPERCVRREYVKPVLTAAYLSAILWVAAAASVIVMGLWG
jgi:hypothetical protein